MQIPRFFVALIAVASISSCSSVGKHDAFVTYKNNATALKTETDTILSEALKLDLNIGQKLKASRATDQAAAAHEALRDAITKETENKKSIEAISRALRKVELGKGEPSELIDKWIEALDIARRDLEEANASPETKPEEVKTIEAAVKTAEKSLARKVDELKTEQIQARALASKLNASVSEAKERHKQAQLESKRAVDQFILDLPGTETDPFRWGKSGGAVPSSLKLKYNKDKLIDCFVEFEKYCALLNKLANPELINPEEFKNSAEALNASANKLLNLDLDIANGSSVALVSQTALGIAQTYLKDRQARTSRTWRIGRLERMLPLRHSRLPTLWSNDL